MPALVITGANRGLGLGYIHELSQDGGNIIFALTRKPQAAIDLDAIAARGPAKARIIEFDVSDADSIACLPRPIKSLLPDGVPVHALINDVTLLQDSESPRF